VDAGADRINAIKSEVAMTEKFTKTIEGAVAKVEMDPGDQVAGRKLSRICGYSPYTNIHTCLSRLEAGTLGYRVLKCDQAPIIPVQSLVLIFP
jgi:hypothetical protein